MSWQAVLDCLDRSDGFLPYASAATFHVEESGMPTAAAAIGLDTNALKLLRQQPLLASSLVAWVSEAKIPLIVPGQALQEFWNNHRTFLRGSETLERDLQSLSSNVKKIASQTTSDHLIEQLRIVEGAVQDFERESLEARDPELFNKSASVWAAIDSVAVVPHVPRSRFLDVGTARFSSKTAPGFEDLDKYPRHLGDFFVWADLLYGLVLARDDGTLKSGRVIFYTDDAKQDWLTSGKPHPTLAAEVFMLFERALEIISPTKIVDLISA